MSDTQQGWRTTSGGGGGGSSTITIQNTLYVMSNGDDATALPNRLDKPFLTIYGATQQAVTGDVIYVFAGLYNEGSNDVFGDGVSYVLESGVIVECEDSVITDNGSAKALNIIGEGILQNTNGDSPLINITADSTLNLVCEQLLSQGEAILCSGKFDINVKTITSNESTKGDHSITFKDNNSTFTYGIINVDSLNSKSNLSSIYLNECNTDLSERNIFININQIVSSLISNDYTFDFDTNNETKIYLQVQNCEEFGNSSLIRVLSTNLFINNCNFYNTNDVSARGIRLLNNAVLLMTNSNIIASSVVLLSVSNSCLQVNNCILKSTNDRTIFCRSTSEMSIYDSTIISGNGASETISVISTSFLRLKNCTIIANDVLTKYSINAFSNPTNIYIYGQCSANKPTNAFILNQVAGTNIVVDSDIVENTDNFI